MDLLRPGLLLSPLQEEHQLRLAALESRLQELAEPTSKGKPCPAFIGSHPVSLTLDNIHDLATHDFLLCEKSDGVRYLMLILSNGEAYLHSRNTGGTYHTQKQFFLTDLRLPQEFCQGDLFNLEVLYVFDGELVQDTLGNNSTQIYFLLFDTLYSLNRSVMTQSYLQRLQEAQVFLQGLSFFCSVARQQQVPLEYSSLQDELTPEQKCHLLLKLKDFFQVEYIQFISEQVVPKLKHGNDGLIFTRNQAEYVVGRSNYILKWKPPHLITVDFLLVPNPKVSQALGENSPRVVDLYVSKLNPDQSTEHIFLDFMWVEDQEYQQIQGHIQSLREATPGIPVLGVVGECSFNPDKPNLTLQCLAALCPEEEGLSEEAKGEALGQFVFGQSLENTFYKQNEENDFQGFQDILNHYMVKGFQGNWRLDRYRLDKSDPNGTRTAQNVIKTIFEDLGLKQLTRLVWESVGRRRKGNEMSMVKKVKF